MNKAFRFLLCVIDILSKYAWVVPLKDKKGVSIVNAFQKILKESNQKPNKIWVDKGSEFSNNSFKKWLKDNDIEIYLIHNEGKPVVAERFIRKLKTKIHKYMISVSKNVYIDKLEQLRWNHTIKMKECKIEKVIRRKDDKLYVKWKGYDNSFNSWIDKKRFSIISYVFKNTSCFATYKNESIFS